VEKVKLTGRHHGLVMLPRNGLCEAGLSKNQISQRYQPPKGGFTRRDLVKRAIP